MYYEINVAQNGKHVFATAERSLRSKEEVVKVYLRLMVAFPEHEGFSITASKWENVGESVNILELLKEK